MNLGYSNFTKRLRSYRKEKNLSQEEMRGKFAVNQSHYSKIESGKSKISYDKMKMFEHNGGDIYYLITGETIVHGIADEYLGRCQTSIGKNAALELLLWLAKQGILLEKSDESKLFRRARKYLELSELINNGLTIWEGLRIVEHLTQAQLAEMLEISEKKYRRIERYEDAPDSQHLSILYERLEYSPLTFLYNDSYQTDELNRIWNTFTEYTQIRLKKLLDENFKLIEEYEKTNS